MTREELAVIVWRELLTMVNVAEAVNAILSAADDYALTECEKTLEVVS